MNRHTQYLKSALEDLSIAARLVVEKANAPPPGSEQATNLALAGIMAATLLAAAANIATLELLEKEYSDSD
jgi:hypothetical protein